MTGNKLLLVTAISMALTACLDEINGDSNTSNARLLPTPSTEPTPNPAASDSGAATTPLPVTPAPSSLPDSLPTSAPNYQPAPTVAPTSEPSYAPAPTAVPAEKTITIEERERGFCGVDDGGSIDTEHPGFVGTGYVNTANVDGASIYWNVTVTHTGMYNLVLRYSNGDEYPRDGWFIVNGEKREYVSMPHTGRWSWDWQTYKYSDVTPLYLEAGDNVVRLSANAASGLPNIDNLSIKGMPVQPKSCGSSKTEAPSSSGNAVTPTATPTTTASPTAEPATPAPTAEPRLAPIYTPIVAPTAPTATPTAAPTATPTPTPTAVPTTAPRSDDGAVLTGDLLTLNPSKAGQSGYVLWDVNASDDTYLGAFLIPDGRLGDGSEDNFFYNDNPTIAVHSSNKLFMRGRYGSGKYAGVAELNIPAQLSRSTELSDLPIATASQDFYWPYPDLWEDNSFRAYSHNGLFIGGMCVIDDKLVGTLYGMYVGDTSMAPLWVLDGTDLNSSGIRGMWDSPHIDGSHYAGWISPIPSEFQGTLKGTHLFGMSQGNMRSLNYRGSNGPSLFTYDFNAQSSITGHNPPADGSPLVLNRFMDFGLFELSEDQNAAGAIWTNLSEAFYGFIIPGTRTYAVFGHSGGHTHGVTYGAAPWLDTKSYYANDRTDHDNHYWLFDLNEILNAEHPGTPRPYEHGAIDTKWHEDGLIFQSPFAGYIHGASYDVENKILYFVAHDAEPKWFRNSESELSLIIAYDLSGVAR